MPYYPARSEVLCPTRHQTLLALDQLVVSDLADAEAGQAEKLQAVKNTAKHELDALEPLD